MITLDQMERMIREIADGLPEEIFKRLNGGILLLPHEKRKNNDLIVLGEYHRDHIMGRYIVIYYGSFCRMFSRLSPEQIKEKLEATIKHEFIHHLENMAGEKDLEREDAKFIAQYYKRRGFIDD